MMQRKSATGVPLNVIIPMGGSSAAFAREGYVAPVPLLRIIGRPMIFWLLDNLSLAPHDTVSIGVLRAFDSQFGLERQLRAEYPNLDLRFTFLDFATRGSAETLAAILSDLAPELRGRRTLVLNCNTVFFSDVLRRFRVLAEGEGTSFYFGIDEGRGEDAARYSYLRMSDDGRGTIVDLREKVAISRSANAGAYGFPSAALLRECVCELLDGHLHPSLDPHATAPSPPASPFASRSASGCSSPQLGGSSPRHGTLDGVKIISLYISTVIQHMMATRSVRFVGTAAPELAVLNTPRALRAFIRQVQTGEIAGARAMRFCFDLDGTLLQLGAGSSSSAAGGVVGDDTANNGVGGGGDDDAARAAAPPCDEAIAGATPIERNVRLVRGLHKAGHTIIIHTSRGGSAGASMARVGLVTFQQLEQFDIPYNEIVFGKPEADVYVSSSTINSINPNIDKELGWDLSDGRVANHDGAAAVAPRHFNSVHAVDAAHIIKTGPLSVMKGELHWYRSAPAALAPYFPAVTELSTQPETNSASIVMARISGVTFSHLLTNGCMTRGRLALLLEALASIHECAPRALVPPAEPSDTHAAAAGANLPPAIGAAAADGSAPTPLLPPEPRAKPEQLCSNYYSKVFKRYEQYSDVYASFQRGHADSASPASLNVSALATACLHFLREFEHERRWRHAWCGVVAGGWLASPL